MPTCKNCGRKGLFLLLDSNGLCSNCHRESARANKSIRRQIEQLEKERNAVLSSKDLTPEEVDGYSRSYHYKDVNVWVFWQYGGRYGKTCKSIGMRRGDTVELVPHHRKDDPKQISIRWRDIEVANMKTSRMRDMVHLWKKANLPIRCVVSSVGGEQKLLLEFSFYGQAK